jgi:hypothetical protein
VAGGVCLGQSIRRTPTTSSCGARFTLLPKERDVTEKPYLERTIIEKVWNPNYDQEALCQCGHPYYRHFDTYEDMMACGCKYCECGEFVDRASA